MSPAPGLTAPLALCFVHSPMLTYGSWKQKKQFSWVLYLCHNQLMALEPTGLFPVALASGTVIAQRYSLSDFSS
jgi:hypothetical protein